MKPDNILLYGSGPCAAEATEKLLEEKAGAVIRIMPDDSSGLVTLSAKGKNWQTEIFTRTNITACKGCIGDFTLTLSNGSQSVIKNASHIIIAQEYYQVPNYSLYGLDLSENVLCLEEAKALAKTREADPRLPRENGKIVFLTGLFHESHPKILEEIMNLTSDFQSKHQVQTYILTNNLKVAGNGLERLYREIKNKGVFVIKSTHIMPKIEQEPEGNVQITYFDEVLRNNFSLRPDLTIIDHSLVPTPDFKRLSKVLGINRDKNGFLQADNIHRQSIFTNRKGILVLGPSRNIVSSEEQQTDIDNAVFEVIKHHLQKDQKQEMTAEIDTKACARCLTCYRLCPHKAVRLEEKITIMPEACEGCGICAADCPALAIKLNSDTMDTIDRLENMDSKSKSKPGEPSIAVLACSRSAMAANESAKNKGLDYSKEIKTIRVPCAGSVSIRHILKLFKNNVDGILVMACHEDNCFSESGNTHARIRLDHMKQKLKEMGVHEDRLKMTSIASNMDALFIKEINRFQKDIEKLEQL